VLSDEELRQWRELEAELAKEPRLVRLANRLANTNPNALMPRTAWLLWISGTSVGLIIVVAGWIANDSSVGMAGAGILILTVVLAGMATLMIGISGIRRSATG
jgi:Protein of unknown function (DUF3040)